MKTFYWSFLLMLLPSMAYTQNTEKENEFAMSMQIRPRAEYRNGALTPRDEGVAPTSFINNRARLSMDYKRSDLELKMSAPGKLPKEYSSGVRTSRRNLFSISMSRNSLQYTGLVLPVMMSSATYPASATGSLAEENGGAYACSTFIRS